MNKFIAASLGALACIVILSVQLYWIGLPAVCH